MRFSARILGVLLSFLIVLFVSKTVFAQTNNYLSSTGQTQQQLSNNPNLHNLTQNVMIEVLSAMTCQLAGVDPTNPNQKCLGIDKKTGQIGYVDGGGGAIGMVGNMIASLYTPPIRVGDYFSYLAGNFGLTKPTYAAATNSIGWQGLQPVFVLWTIFRNIAYFLFILIFIVVGIAIMLRVRIDPRTVMSIQNQIPKLVIGIILVTFAFAIAGFLIDIMWVVTYMAISTINPSNVAGIANSMTQSVPGFANYVFGASGGSPSGLGLISIMVNAAGAIGGFIQPLFNSNQLMPQTTGSQCSDIFCSLGNFFSQAIQDIIGTVLGFVMGWVAGIIAFLIIAIAIVVQLLRLWFKLLVAYILILIDVVLSPLWIVAGLLPGAGPSVGFGAWIRDILGNLMVFPAVVALFLFGNVIYYNYGSAGGQAFNPPLIGNATGSAASGFAALIALGVILMAPSVVDQVKKAFKSSGLGAGVGGISAGQAVMAGAVGGALGRTFRVNPNTQEAIGPGAQWLHRKVNNRVTRFVFGFKTPTTEQVVKEASQPKSTTKST